MSVLERATARVEHRTSRCIALAESGFFDESEREDHDALTDVDVFFVLSDMDAFFGSSEDEDEEPSDLEVQQHWKDNTSTPPEMSISSTDSDEPDGDAAHKAQIAW